jgi:segregation and condensation protein B
LHLEDEREAFSLMKILSETYEKDNSVLEIQRLPQEKVVLQLKSDYSRQASRFSIKPLLTAGPLRTLSYVAYHQPVEQTEVALARGSQSYKHLKMLEDIGLIKRIKAGRTKIIRTTQDFADHLGLSQDRTTMRRELRKLFRKLEVEQIEKNNMRVRIN